MPCSNCYTGCTQIISDKCIKYTGLPNEVLGIKTGDSINYTTAAMMCFVTSSANGTGIKFTLDEDDMCSVVSDNLQDCSDITVIDITRALSKAICTLDTSITTNSAVITAMNAGYAVDCLSVDGTAGVHAVLQATITKACENTAAIAATNLNLSTNYVAIEDINTYIENYVAENITGGATGQASKMVPYTVVEYYGSLTFFDITGAGTGDWVNIYLCNGNNGTPDKRGRVAVGATSDVGGPAFATAVDPSLTGNPTYALLSTEGSNTVTLNETQLPAHTHTGNTSSGGSHVHTYTQYELDQEVASTGNGVRGLDNSNNQVGSFSTSSGGTHSHSFTTDSVGGGEAHANIQPVIACYYIMYIPA